MFVADPNSYVEILIPGGWYLGVGRWEVLGQACGTLMNGSSVLMKEAQESSLTPSTSCGHSDKPVTWKEDLPWRCQCHDLGIPASRALGNQFLLFVSRTV